jgi:hypothetical protein
MKWFFKWVRFIGGMIVGLQWLYSAVKEIGYGLGLSGPVILDHTSLFFACVLSSLYMIDWGLEAIVPDSSGRQG